MNSVILSTSPGSLDLLSSESSSEHAEKTPVEIVKEMDE